MTTPNDGLHIAWDDTERAWLVFRLAGQEITTLAIRSTHAEALAVVAAHEQGERTMDLSTRLSALACEERDGQRHAMAMTLMGCAAQARRMERQLDDAVQAAFRREQGAAPVLVEFPRTALRTDTTLLRGFGTPQEEFIAQHEPEWPGVRVDPDPDSAA